MRRVILAGGGSLGAISPLIGIASSLDHCDCLFIITKQGPEAKLLKEYALRYITISSGKWRRYPSFKNFIDLFKIAAGFFQAYKILKTFKPEIVLTAGGFNAVPVAYAAAWLKIPVVIHQQDFELGLANKLMAPVARVITCSLPEMQSLFHQKSNLHVTGNPLRQMPSGSGQSDSLLILGGSQGARGLNEAVRNLIPSWAEKFNVIHILGKDNMDQALALKKNYEARPFVVSEMGQLLHRAKLIVSRGGMSTLTELSALQKAAIIIPMPHSHQEQNADFFEKKQAIITIAQTDVEKLDQQVTILMDDPARLAELGQHLSNCFPTQANEQYIKLLESFLSPKQSRPITAFLAGIGGIGVSAVARYFLHLGYRVEGSDLSPTQITTELEKLGVKITYGQKAENVHKNINIVVYSDALLPTNPELLQAKKNFLPLYTYSEFIGVLSRRYTTVAISGTHGKTTTTAMTGLTAIEAGLSPTIFVGSLVSQLQSNFYAGNSQLMIAEADEYRSHMLNLRPTIGVVTNIDDDHLDYYRDIQHIELEFQKFAQSIPSHGYLIVNADDERAIALTTTGVKITFGFSERADIRAYDMNQGELSTTFKVRTAKEELGTFELAVPGTFNVQNALAVIAIARALKIDMGVVVKALKEYKGSWRRFEFIGALGDAPCFSDYAHHPTEVTVTLQAAKTRFKDKKIIAVFQPHSIERTESHFNEFVQALSLADELVVTHSFHVAGRDESKKDDPAELLFKAIVTPHKQFITLDQLGEYLTSKVRNDCIVLFLGAGSIDSVARKLCHKV